MLLLTCTSRPVSESDFVKYWEPGYFSNLEKPEDDDTEYLSAIDSWTAAADPMERLSVLFKWKNGRNLSGRKKEFIENIWKKIDGLGGVQSAKAKNPRELLDALVKDHGVIWSIFLLHCLHPGEYPIFDRYVYRAVTFIESKEEDIDTCKDVVGFYFGEYLPFWQGLCRRLGVHGAHERRTVDRALWAFGRFLSGSYAFMVK